MQTTAAAAAATKTITRHRFRHVQNQFVISRQNNFVVLSLGKCRQCSIASTTAATPRSHNDNRTSSDCDKNQDVIASTYRQRCGAKPLFFQRTPSSKNVKTTASESTPTPLTHFITPYHLRGTTAVLPPSQWHSSPCLGAALANSPFVGNLMRYHQRNAGASTGSVFVDDSDVVDISDNHGDDSRMCFHLDEASKLSNRLFFRLIPESPIHLVRNKSMPGSYLTPGLVGCFLSNYWSSTTEECSGDGENISKTTKKRSTKNKSEKSTIDSHQSLQDKLRSRFGIRSNRIGTNDEWTGISLARWMELNVPRSFKSSCVVDSEGRPTVESSLSQSSLSTQLLADTLVPASWLVALWGVTGNREELTVDYKNSLLNHEMLDNDVQHGTPVNTTTQSTSFVPSDFSKANLSAAMDHLRSFYDRPKNAFYLEMDKKDSKDIKDAAEAFELVCASIALSHEPDDFSPKPQPVPNGYYMHGADADIYVPDCVEVAVREILQFLLFPVNHHRERKDGDATIDVSTLPSTSSRRLRELLIRQQYQQGPEYSDHPLKQQQSDIGQAWFDLLSNLPYCQYFVITPSGIRYELIPTVENLCTALWCLLVDGKNVDKYNQEKQDKSEPGRPWKSLQELADFWNSHQSTNEEGSMLYVKQDTLKHIQPSTGRIMQHEVVCLQLDRNPNALEIRMRCDWNDESGMAAVTHLREGTNHYETLLKPHQVESMFDLLKSQYNLDTRSHNLNGKPVQPDPSLAMLCFALIPFRSVGHVKQDLPLFCLTSLSTAYGIDRRELRLKDQDMLLSENNDFNAKALVQSREVLKDKIRESCDYFGRYPLVSKRLLTWILQESPTVTESSSSTFHSRQEMLDPRIECCILKIPVDALDDQVLDAIGTNWACRGRALSVLLRLQIGMMTVPQLAFLILRGRLGLGDMIDMINLRKITN